MAANYGGRAINITQTTAAHAMSYKITSLYKFPHGHAVAVCLPTIWEFMLNHMDKCIDLRGLEYLVGIFNKIANAMGASSSFEAIDLFRQMMHELDLYQPIFGDRERELFLLSSSVNSIRLKNNPVQLNADVIKQLYEIIVI